MLWILKLMIRYSQTGSECFVRNINSRPMLPDSTVIPSVCQCIDKRPMIAIKYCWANSRMPLDILRSDFENQYNFWKNQCQVKYYIKYIGTFQKFSVWAHENNLIFRKTCVWALKICHLTCLGVSDYTTFNFINEIEMVRQALNCLSVKPPSKNIVIETSIWFYQTTSFLHVLFHARVNEKHVRDHLLITIWNEMIKLRRQLV